MKIFIFLVSSFLAASSFAQSETEALLARQYYQNGDYDKASVAYKKLFSQNPELFYDGYFNTLLKQRNYSEAEKVVKKLYKESPDNYSYGVDIGRVTAEQGQEQKAAEWYNNLITALPKNETAIRNLATEFYRAELYDYSIKTFLYGRRLIKDEKAFAFDLISLYRFQKNKSLLVQEYLNVIEDNPQVQTQALNILSSVFEDRADYDSFKIALLKRLQKDPQSIPLTEMLQWQYMQQKEYDLALRQSIALDKRLRENGERIYELSFTLISNKAYTTAIDGLQYLIEMGKDSQYYIPAKIQLLNAKNQMLTSGKFAQGDIIQLETDYKNLLAEFGKSSSTVFAMRQLASLQAFYLNKPKEAEALLEEAVKMVRITPSVIGQTKLELGDIYILTGELWESSLVYGQVEKQFADEPTGQEAKFRNARLSYYQGDFSWAKAQLDVLKSSTSQLIANDALNLSLLISENSDTQADSNALKMYSRADMAIFKNKLPEAITILDSIDKQFPGNSLVDDILMSKAKILIKQANWQQAAVQLQQIIANYSYDLWADDAVFTLADLYENQLNDPAKAKELYQKIITDYPGSMFISEARKRFRNLRGDNIG
ncbi:tetratricopeptide repeat protein [Pedobacter sp. HMF7647]|uniref:Tetratricopeptide repeat protein n=1 Tax=Hufsiella arboris TaxID=2695275 RepID=A0A7K1Y4A4_9SPHI|nr:tetratricopeptide repeat protein [Hufsiella arboris]MXV49384.1 tetratricopeptide repeat protein [Hufsiella arboris]